MKSENKTTARGAQRRAEMAARNARWAGTAPAAAAKPEPTLAEIVDALRLKARRGVSLPNGFGPVVTSILMKAASDLGYVADNFGEVA